MPFYHDPNLDNDQEIAQGVQLSGASPVAAPTGNSTASAQNQAQSRDVKSGSGFQNLDKYLSTNQAQGFGGQVLGKVENQITNAADQMNKAADQFRNQVGQSGTAPSQADITKAVADPTKADAKQFQAWTNQTYEGPRSLSESQDAWNKYWSGTKQAQSSAGMLGNESGRFALLDQYFGKPSYGFGQKSLDNLLVQQSGLGNETKALQNQAAQLQAQGNAQAEQLQGLASKKAGEIEQSRNAARAAVGINEQGGILTGANAGALGKAQEAAQRSLEQANAQRQAQQNQLAQNLATGKLSQEQASALGLTGGENLYNLDLSQYASMGNQLGLNQVMTPEQRAQIQALSNLAGVTDTFASGAPEAQSAAYGFDVNRFKADVGAREAQYQNALNNTPVTVPGMSKAMTIPELETEIARMQKHGGGGLSARSDYLRLNEAIPALNRAKAALANQFGVGRKLGIG